MTRAYVGIGSNIGEPRRQLQAALKELSGLPNTRVTATSGLYRSAPLDYLDQPEFLNAVVELETELPPEALLDNLQEIEKAHGRQRPFAGAPRTLDLDLLLYGDAALATPRLTVPHPRMHERAFVLKPLAEIAPGVAIPGRGPARGLLSACGDQVAERID
jgi:2-amino-4-hydroxy-6-hydroxymethyldihydropteridine diphosphokinase